MALMTGRGFQEEGEAAGKWRRALLTSTQLSTYFVGYTEVAAIAARPPGRHVTARTGTTRCWPTARPRRATCAPCSACDACLATTPCRGDKLSARSSGLSAAVACRNFPEVATTRRLDGRRGARSSTGVPPSANDERVVGDRAPRTGRAWPRGLAVQRPSQQPSTPESVMHAENSDAATSRDAGTARQVPSAGDRPATGPDRRLRATDAAVSRPMTVCGGTSPCSRIAVSTGAVSARRLCGGATVQVSLSSTTRQPRVASSVVATLPSAYEYDARTGFCACAIVPCWPSSRSYSAV